MQVYSYYQFVIQGVILIVALAVSAMPGKEVRC